MAESVVGTIIGFVEAHQLLVLLSAPLLFMWFATRIFRKL